VSTNGRIVVCNLFNDAINNPDSIESNNRMTVNGELERMWKEAVVF
jgi:hypothetical protein